MENSQEYDSYENEEQEEEEFSQNLSSKVAAKRSAQEDVSTSSRDGSDRLEGDIRGLVQSEVMNAVVKASPDYDDVMSVKDDYIKENPFFKEIANNPGFVHFSYATLKNSKVYSEKKRASSGRSNPASVGANVRAKSAPSGYSGDVISRDVISRDVISNDAPQQPDYASMSRSEVLSRSRRNLKGISLDIFTEARGS